MMTSLSCTKQKSTKKKCIDVKRYDRIANNDVGHLRRKQHKFFFGKPIIKMEKEKYSFGVRKKNNNKDRGQSVSGDDSDDGIFQRSEVHAHDQSF